MDIFPYYISTIYLLVENIYKFKLFNISPINSVDFLSIINSSIIKIFLSFIIIKNESSSKYFSNFGVYL